MFATIEYVDESAEDMVRRYWHVTIDAADSNIVKACRKHGLDRGQFGRLRKAYRKGGDEALYEAARRSVLRDPLVLDTLRTHIFRAASAHPQLGRFRLTRMLKDQGIAVTTRQVARVLQKMRAEAAQKR